MSSMDDLFGPMPGGRKRPVHPDFTTLVDVVLMLDGRSTEDPDFDLEAYMLGYVDPESIAYMTSHRAMRFNQLKFNGQAPPELEVAFASLMFNGFFMGIEFEKRRQSTDRSERAVWRITAADVDEILGRTATDDELATVAKALDNADDLTTVIETVLEPDDG